MIRSLLLRSPMGLAVFLGLIHFLVDAASLTVLYDEAALDRSTAEEVNHWIDLYNMLAFGLQFPLGLAADRGHEHRWAVLVGLECLVLALTIGTEVTSLAVILAGLGNALFHLGAGAMVLRSCQGRASEAGVFVAPGWFGVAVGMRLGGSGPTTHRWLIAALLTCGGILVLDVVPIVRRWVSTDLPGPPRGIQTPPTRLLHQSAGSDGPNLLRAGWILGAGLLLISVMLRSVLAGVFRGPDPEIPILTFPLLPLAVVAGKALGGLAADRWGWRLTAVAALLTLAVLVASEPAHPCFALLALFLAQSTMAVSLAGLSVALPGRPATAFGLTSLALLLGSRLRASGLFPDIESAAELVPVVLGSAVTVFLGLSLVPRRACRPQ